ncbi:MAG: diguanylate cyclase [Rhodoferax sp.]
MVSVHRIFDGRRLLALLSLLIVAGFFATTLGSYFVSRNVIREAIIGQELPLASSNIYVALQKDLVQPVLISSTMAHDTFLRDWVLQGERNVSEMNRYLQEVKTRYGAFSTFFVSERSANYYTGSGVLKKVSPDEPRDAWYYRVRDLKADHEINVDLDMANQDAMTIFINYRVFDFAGKYLGATGIGVTMDAMHQRIKDYQQRYQRTIYFVDHQGKTVLFDQNARQLSPDLHDRPGLRELVDRILLEKNGGYQYQADGVNYLLNVHYIPELNWYLFVEKDESVALVEVRKTLYINLGICLLITLLVVMLMNLSLSRYQRRIEEMASTDKLTGLFNRQAYTILMDKLMAEYVRQPRPVSVLLLDLDHFKPVNDQYGHAMGDQVLRSVASQLRQVLRKSDIAVRWGGEEFLVVLNYCALDEARQIAEKIRQRIAQECLDMDGKHIALSVSIGVSQFSGDELPDQTISRADAGLYQAKQGGRNRVDVAAASLAPAV